jgi:hypothetical protein
MVQKESTAIYVTCWGKCEMIDFARGAFGVSIKAYRAIPTCRATHS